MNTQDGNGSHTIRIFSSTWEKGGVLGGTHGEKGLDCVIKLYAHYNSELISLLMGTIWIGNRMIDNLRGGGSYVRLHD